MQKIYAIHDITAEIYTTPFYAVNDATAARIFANARSTPGTSIFDNPEDFRLYRIGSYDEQTGNIIPEPFELICRASDYSAKDLSQATLETINQLREA